MQCVYRGVTFPLISPQAKGITHSHPSWGNTTTLLSSFHSREQLSVKGGSSIKII